MKLRVTVVVCCLALSPLVGASEITYQSRLSNSGPYSDGTSLRSAVETLTAAAPGAHYCDANPSAWTLLSNQITCGGYPNNIAVDIAASFGVTPELAGAWSFRVGGDFGYGAALFVDGIELDFLGGMWWYEPYGYSPSNSLAATLHLGAGNHIVEVYGRENCCDAWGQGQFRPPGASNWVTFSANDGLDLITVPEPGTLALLGIGLAGLTAARRRRQ